MSTPWAATATMWGARVTRQSVLYAPCRAYRLVREKIQVMPRRSGAIVLGMSDNTSEITMTDAEHIAELEKRITELENRLPSMVMEKLVTAFQRCFHTVIEENNAVVVKSVERRRSCQH